MFQGNVSDTRVISNNKRFQCVVHIGTTIFRDSRNEHHVIGRFRMAASHAELRYAYVGYWLFLRCILHIGWFLQIDVL